MITNIINSLLKENVRKKTVKIYPNDIYVRAVWDPIAKRFRQVTGDISEVTTNLGTDLLKQNITSRFNNSMDSTKSMFHKTGQKSKLFVEQNVTAPIKNTIKTASRLAMLGIAARVTLAVAAPIATIYALKSN